MPILHGESLIGTRVAGFELTRCVARGPMASVFEGVRDTTRAAIKIYFRTWATRDERDERDEREEQAQRQIAHPCVARALATDRLRDGSFVLASEWIDGASLEARLAQGPLPWAASLGILRDIARGLGAIHGAKVVHRDLKPSNLMLPAGGTPAAVIVDFGHALVVDDTRLTGTGLVLGSAHYMAPEQAQGLALDHRVDLYAVGVVLYRMLTGALPFDHHSAAEVMRLHQQEPVPPLRVRTTVPVPAAAEDLCLWLLAKDPAQRVPNAHVLRVTIEALERSIPTRQAPEITA
jgi:eukaryotic-like serine/threonine-protein kinase